MTISGPHPETGGEAQKSVFLQALHMTDTHQHLRIIVLDYYHH